MAKILAIKSVFTKAGKPNVLVSTAEKDIWVPYGQWQSKGASDNFDGYVGGNIEVDFFAKGDILLNGQECTQDGIILRDFAVSMNPAVVAYAVAAETAQRASKLSDAAAIFRRRRLERQEQTPAVEAGVGAGEGVKEPEHEEA